MGKVNKQAVDPDVAKFEADLLESIGQAQRGQYARVHTPAEIEERIKRARGRPPVEVKKSTLTLRTKPAILEHLRASGKGWQTRVNALIEEAVAQKRL